MSLDSASVLDKVMVVLHAFVADDHGVGFAALQRRTALPKVPFPDAKRDSADPSPAGRRAPMPI